MFDPVLDTAPIQRHIVVCGTGKVSRASVTSLIEDLHESYGEDVYLVAVLGDNQSEAAMHVGEWAVDFDHRLMSFKTAKEKLTSRQQALWSGAEETAVLHKPSEMLKHIRKTDVLCVAYDESDSETMRFVAAALKAGIPTKDLTMGLADIVIEDSPDDEDEDDIPTGGDFPTVWVEDSVEDAEVAEVEDDGFRAFRKKLNEAADEIIEEALREYRRKTGKRNRERTRAD